MLHGSPVPSSAQMLKKTAETWIGFEMILQLKAIITISLLVILQQLYPIFSYLEVQVWSL